MTLQDTSAAYTDESKLKAAYALNLCSVSISQIIDYNDINILNQEYDNILNNLNLEQIPKDEALLDVLKEILDVITFFRKSTGDQKFVDLEYQQRMQNAVWSAIPNVGMIFATSNPIAMGVTLATQVGIGYMNYRRHRAEYQLNRQKEEWQLKRNALDQLNGLRKQLFETSWRLAKEYNFPDRYRLSDDQIHRYNEILAETNSLKRFNKLDAIREDFAAYPPYWYQIGSTANCIYRDTEWGLDISAKTQFKEQAIVSFEKYRKLNQFNILRNDVLTSSWALEYIDLLDLSCEANRKEAAALVEIAEKYSGKANDVLELCGYAYLKVGDRKNAARIFYYLVNQDYNVPVTAKVLSALYILKSREAGNEDSGTTDYKMLEKLVNSEYILPMPDPEIALDTWDPVWRTVTSTTCTDLGADATNNHFGNETCDSVDAVASDNCGAKYFALIAHLKSYLDGYPLDSASEKAQEKFLQKYMPMVAKKTIIGMTKVPEVVLTTWGIHFLNMNQEPVALAYKSIDFTKTTITRTDDGTPLGVYLRTRDTATQDYLHIRQPEEFLEMLQKAAQMETAQTDSIKSISQMPEIVKLAYGKLLVFFGQQCQLEWIESIRMAHDTKMMRETFEILLVYAYGNHVESELDDLIREFKRSLPYPNEESISYALIQSLVALIQFSSGRCRGITAFETSKIDEIAGKLEISKEIVDKLIPVAQIPYRTLKRDITPKEISNATQALATIAAGVGIPVATVLGSAFLWANIWWFMFIPGIGTVITTAALGVTAVTALFGGKRKSDSELMEKNIQTQMESLIESYTSLLNTMLGLPQCKSEISLVLEAAKRTDYVLGKHLGLELSGKNAASNPESGGVAPSECGNTIEPDKKAAIFELVDSLKKKGGSFYKSRLDMSESECASILWQMAHLQKEYISQVAGLYDVSITNSITGNVSGILFVIDGFYFKQTPTSAPQYMPYSEITSVEEKFSTLIVQGAETSIKMKSISYAQSYMVDLFNKLRHFSN